MDAISGQRSSAPSGTKSLPPGVATLVRSLSLAVVLQWAGAGAILPLLPLFVKHHGGSDAIVGAVMAAYFAAAFLFQYGSGRISDRLGRVPVLVGGLIVYAAGSFLFLVPAPPAFFVVFRALQGGGAGAAMVAALAMLSHAVPLSYRGRASGRIYAAELGGLAVGPVLGSVAGVSAMRWLFIAAGVASVVAIAPALAAGRVTPALEVPQGVGPAPEGVRSEAEAPSPARRPSSVRAASRIGGWKRPWTVAERAIWGALIASAALGLLSGVYESCWTLLMTRLGAASWEVGVSWTLFALPFVAMSRPAGWLADRFDRRWLGVASLCWMVSFCAGYPFVPNVVLLMVLGVWESVGFALALPAMQSLLGEGTDPERHGHAQGLFAASQTGTTTLAAAAAGGLFGLASWLPFDIAAACGAVLMLVVGLAWRRVPGRVNPEGRPRPEPAARTS